MNEYAGQRVFISGGTSGLGRAIALLLAQQGAHVCIAARGASALESTLVEMQRAASGRNTILITRQLDVSDPAAVEAVAAEAVTALGGLDILLCVQGLAKTGLVHEIELTHYKHLLEVNFLGHAYLCRAFAPHFIRRKRGTVVLVSSVLGYLSTYGYAAYSASKWAIVGFGESLRQELGLHGVKVKLVYPGTMQTRGLEQENVDKPRAVWEIESNNPFNKLRSADDVARRLLKAARGWRFENPIGWDGWLSFVMSRYAPWLVRKLNDGDLRAALAKYPPPET